MPDLRIWTAAFFTSTLALGCVSHEATRDVDGDTALRPADAAIVEDRGPPVAVDGSLPAADADTTAPIDARAVDARPVADAAATCGDVDFDVYDMEDTLVPEGGTIAFNVPYRFTGVVEPTGCGRDFQLSGDGPPHSLETGEWYVDRFCGAILPDDHATEFGVFCAYDPGDLSLTLTVLSFAGEQSARTKSYVVVE